MLGTISEFFSLNGTKTGSLSKNLNWLPRCILILKTDLDLRIAVGRWDGRGGDHILADARPGIAGS